MVNIFDSRSSCSHSRICSSTIADKGIGVSHDWSELAHAGLAVALLGCQMHIQPAKVSIDLITPGPDAEHVLFLRAGSYLDATDNWCCTGCCTGRQVAGRGLGGRLG